MNYNDLIVVSVGVNGREKYGDNAKQQEEMLNQLGIQNKIWINEYPPESPDHSSMPYAFKYFAIKYAVDLGYKKILWLDSICRIKGDTKELVSILDSNGYFFPPDGWSVGQWCKDEALEPLGITREEAFTIPVLAAKHLGFNFDDSRNTELLKQFKYYIDYKKGDVFRGSWTNKKGEVSRNPKVLGHRHDQTVLSVIAWRLGMTLDGRWNEMITWGKEEKPRQVIGVR